MPKLGLILGRIAACLYMCSLLAVPVPAQEVGFVDAGAPASSQSVPRASVSGNPAVTGSKLESTGEENSESASPQPRIRLVEPPPAATNWTLREKIAWALCVILSLVTYFAILTATRTIRLQKRELQSMQTMLESMTSNADAVTLQAQATINLQRPWIRMEVERAKDLSNTFHIVAVNKGRTPAEIVDWPAKIRLDRTEGGQSKKDVAMTEEMDLAVAPIILLPDESTVVQRFGRGDIKRFCTSEESLNRVKRCEAKVLLTGSVIYRDMISAADKNTHRTDWCYRYVHGESISDLVADGSPALIRHT